MLKLKPTAVASVIATLPEMTDIERAAAEKLPIKYAVREIAQHLTSDLDAALQIAVERFLGHALKDPEEIRGRLTHGPMEGEEGEFYCVDNVPVLWAGPVALVREGDTMRGERQLRHLLDEPA